MNQLKLAIQENLMERPEVDFSFNNFDIIK